MFPIVMMFKYTEVFIITMFILTYIGTILMLVGSVFCISDDRDIL